MGPSCGHLRVKTDFNNENTNSLCFNIRTPASDIEAHDSVSFKMNHLAAFAMADKRCGGYRSGECEPHAKLGAT